MITGKNQIGFTQSAKGNITFKTFNPQKNSENDSLFYKATSQEINDACFLATEAFKTFKKTSGSQKAAFLNAIADEILALDDKLIKTYRSESGLPEGRAQGERGRTVFQLRSFANLVTEGSWVDASIDTAIPDRKPLPKVDLRKILVPLGPVVVFGASNFPLAYSTAGGDTAAAFAAGCPVIVKSHPMHAGTGELIAQAITKAAKRTGMPDGVFSNLNSSGIEVGVQLVKHPQVKAIGFTGSVGGGRTLYNLAAQRPEPIPVFAEMGSVNPVILMPKAAQSQAEKWGTTLAKSITLGSGQFCTNPGLILGIKGVDLNHFITTLANEIVKIEPSCMLHPNIIGAFEDKKESALSQKGVKKVTGFSNSVSPNYGRQIVTTVEGETFLNNPTLHQEVFGPFSMVVQCEDLRQLETLISQLEGQLTGSLLADNTELLAHNSLVEALQNRVGRLIFNGVPTGVEVCPSMQHGGPYPASTDSRFTAVGIHSIKRWVRPVTFQNWPDEALPDALKNENPLGILRTLNGEISRDKI
ncbi:MAG: aldehyde dehydrogenase (NADP(+)) [Flavobacteriaceae bacterium]